MPKLDVPKALLEDSWRFCCSKDSQMAQHLHVNRNLKWSAFKNMLTGVMINALFPTSEIDALQCECNTKASNQAGFEQIDPTLRVLDYFLKNKSNHHHHLPIVMLTATVFQRKRHKGHDSFNHASYFAVCVCVCCFVLSRLPYSLGLKSQLLIGVEILVLL